MNTYWLLDAVHKNDRDTPIGSRDWKLPGETDSLNDSASLTSNKGQSSSQEKAGRFEKAKARRKPSFVAESSTVYKPTQTSNLDEPFGY